MMKIKMRKKGERALKLKWSRQLDSPAPINSMLLGNKAANLAEMMRLGLPVPSGFTLTIRAWQEFNKKRSLPEKVWKEALSQLKILETKTGKKFADSKNPLLVSVRSGAHYSMPGMMETILDVGINQETVKGLGQRLGKNCAQNSSHRLRTMFKRIVGKEPPQDPYQQLKLAIETIFSSWNNPQSQIYRKYNAIPENAGTAATVQEMVFGNIPNGQSGTGVFFSRDPRTGENRPSGEFVLGGQGEDVVQEKQKARPIPPELTTKLKQYGGILEKHFRAPQDIEFTVEQGKLYLLQSRRLEGTSLAKIRMAADFAKEGLISQDEALLRITPADIQAVLKPSFEAHALAEARKKSLIGRGSPVSIGSAVGRTAFTVNEAEKLNEKGEAVILICPKLDANEIEIFQRLEALITTLGGTASHMALILQKMGKVGLAGIKFFQKPKKGAFISINGASGEVFRGSLPLAEKPQLSQNIKILIEKWRKKFGKSPWASALYPVNKKYSRQAFLEKIKKLKFRMKKWHSPKAQTTVLLNALIPSRFIISSAVLKPTNLKEIREAALKAFKEKGFQPIPRTAHSPEELAHAPWAAITKRKDIEDFLTNPNFPGKYGGLPRWKENKDLEAIIVPAEPKGKLDSNLAHEHFSFTISSLSTQPPKIIVDLQLETAHLRIFEDIPPEKLVRITAFINPDSPYYLGRIETIFGEDCQNNSYAQEVAKIIKRKVFKEWWRPPFSLPHLMAALDESYGLSVLEGQGRMKERKKLAWCLIYGAKGREEKEKVK